MATTDFFEDFDHVAVFETIRTRTLDPEARNFVVEFGPNEAKIAFDLDLGKVEQLLQHGNPQLPPQRPVRWINIWAPNVQTEIVRALGSHYGFSRRFQAILESPPLNVKEDEPSVTTESEHERTKGLRKDDIEQANRATKKAVRREAESTDNANHYTIASHLINYQSMDLGEKFLCIGANFIYNLGNKEKRLWSWLILCSDSTVISLYEDPRGDRANPQCVEATRKHTLDILKQLSKMGLRNPGTMSLVSVRLLLTNDVPVDEHGSEGSSNLFYYLLDNWHNTYLLMIDIQQRLEKLSEAILGGLKQKHQKEPEKDIIPDLYKIGRLLRKYQHLYEGYGNLIERVLKFRADVNPKVGKRVLVALRASERFERLGDRIKLIALNPIKEAIAEQAALLDTYFNINAQNDSAATAKLSRNAALLSKLGVLFLPVSLMTSYFSVQIDDLQGVYTSTTYWVCFAITMFISFVALFFLSRVLVSITESLEARSKATSSWFKQRLRGFGRGRGSASSGTSTPSHEKSYDSSRVS